MYGAKAAAGANAEALALYQAIYGAAPAAAVNLPAYPKGLDFTEWDRIKAFINATAPINIQHPTPPNIVSVADAIINEIATDDRAFLRGGAKRSRHSKSKRHHKSKKHNTNNKKVSRKHRNLKSKYNSKSKKNNKNTKHRKSKHY